MHIHRCTFLIAFLKYSYFQCSPKIHPHTNTFIRHPCQVLLYFLYGEMSIRVMITWMTFLFFLFFFLIKLFTKTSVSRKLENVYNRSRWSQTSRSCSSCLVTIGPNLEGKKSLYMWKVNVFFQSYLIFGNPIFSHNNACKLQYLLPIDTISSSQTV